MRSTSTRLVSSLSPPMLYFWPGRPRVSARENRAAVVVHVEPVADVEAVAVDRERLPSTAFRIVRGTIFSGNWYGP